MVRAMREHAQTHGHVIMSDDDPKLRRFGYTCATCLDDSPSVTQSDPLSLPSLPSFTWQINLRDLKVSLGKTREPYNSILRAAIQTGSGRHAIARVCSEHDSSIGPSQPALVSDEQLHKLFDLSALPDEEPAARTRFERGDPTV